MASPTKRERKILAVELAKLQKLAAPTNAAYEAMQDAALLLDEKKAAYATASTLYLRYGAFLVKRYRIADDQEIHQLTGVIMKSAPKPNVPPAKPAVPTRERARGR